MTDPKLIEFTHLLVEQKGKYFYENEDMRRTHEVLDTINCFSNIGVEYRSVFPIKIKTRPCVILLRRKLDIVPPMLSILSHEPSIESPTSERNADVSNAAPTPTADHSKLDDMETESDSDEQAYENSDDTVDAKDENSQITDENRNEVENVEDNKDTAEEEGDEDYDNENAKNSGDSESGDYQYQDDNVDSTDNDENIIEMDLKRPSRETKLKLKKLIEKHYRARVAHLPPNDQTDLAAAHPSRPSIRSNIKQIIKKEKIKEMIEKISQIDLRAVCDLERESTKQCLLKIIDSFID